MYFSKNLEEKIQEEKTDFNSFSDFKDITQKMTKNVPSKIVNRQYIYSSNYKKSKTLNENFIIANIFSNDSDIEDKIYNLISNPYQKKLNLINLVLDSELHFPLNNYLDIIKFFNWLYPLTIEYGLASGNWNIKSVKYGNREKILLQNSISKVDLNDNFSLQYIGKIKKALANSGVKYYYFEFKSKRFNKIKDIIWAFDKN
jgi:hypothetical protein